MSDRFSDISTSTVFTPPDLPSEEEKIKKVLNRVADLAVLPHVVFKVLEASASTDTACAEIERAIIVDPGFSSKVLTLANSAAYGIPKKVTAIREAIAFLGFRQVRNIAMTVGVFDLFAGKNDKESLRRRAWWRHSIDTALIAQWFAKRQRLAQAEEAYTSGLLHYIGKTLLDRSGIGDYGLVEALVNEGLDDAKAEIEIYGITSVHVTRAAAEKWNLPEALQVGLQYKWPIEPGEPHAELRAVTACASYLAQVAKEGWEPDVTVWRSPAWAFHIAKVDMKDIDQLVTESNEFIASANASQAA